MKVMGPRFQVRVPIPIGYEAAAKAQQRAFWSAVSAFVSEAKEAELKARLDRFGVPMAALRASTIKNRKSAMGPADPHGPQLQPAHGLSRTRALFVAQPTTRLDGVTCFWSYDEHTSDSWGEILRYHKAGNRNLPVRDVIGLSPDSLTRVNQRAAAWWAVYNDLTAMAIRPRPAEPEPTPKFMVQRIPANAEPKAARRVSQLEVNGKSYAFQSGSAAKARDAIGLGKFSGFHTHAEVKELLAKRGTTYDEATRRFKFSFGTKPPPAAPKPVPKPAPKPIPPAPQPLPHSGPPAKPYDLEFRGDLPADIRANHDAAVGAIPAKVHEALAAKGIKFLYGDRFDSAFPEIAGQHPDGWAPGLTWQNSDGVYSLTHKAVAVFREYVNPGGSKSLVSRRQRAVLYHETGHGLDHALGKPSASPEFLRAYDSDVDAIPDDARPSLAYFLAPGGRGPEEAFAELFNNHLGESLLAGKLAAHFPGAMQFIMGLMEALP